MTLHERSGTLFTSTILKGYNYNTRYFKQDDGFQLAFAIVDYSGEEGNDAYDQNLEDYLDVSIW